MSISKANENAQREFDILYWCIIAFALAMFGVILFATNAGAGDLVDDCEGFYYDNDETFCCHDKNWISCSPKIGNTKYEAADILSKGFVSTPMPTYECVLEGKQLQCVSDQPQPPYGFNTIVLNEVSFPQIEALKKRIAELEFQNFSTKCNESVESILTD